MAGYELHWTYLRWDKSRTSVTYEYIIYSAVRCSQHQRWCRHRLQLKSDKIYFKLKNLLQSFVCSCSTVWAAVRNVSAIYHCGNIGNMNRNEKISLFCVRQIATFSIAVFTPPRFILLILSASLSRHRHRNAKHEARDKILFTLFVQSIFSLERWRNKNRTNHYNIQAAHGLRDKHEWHTHTAHTSATKDRNLVSILAAQRQTAS